MAKKNEFSRQPRFLPDKPSGTIEILSPSGVVNPPDILWFEILVPPIVMIVITVLISMLSTNSLYMLITITMTVMTLVSSLVVSASQISKYKKQKKSRERNYLQYLADIRNDLSLKKQLQRNALSELNPLPDDCITRIINVDSKLWERLPGHDDFAFVRLGLGDIPFGVKIKYQKSFAFLDGDKLNSEPEKIALEFERIDKAPLCLDLFNSEICGIAGDENRAAYALRLIALQLITHHGYDDLRIVLAIKEENVEAWNWIKYLRHVWDDEYKNRYILSSSSSIRQTLMQLTDIFKLREINLGRENKTSVQALPHYVFIIEDVTLFNNEPISKYLYMPNKQLGISAVFTAKNRAYLPTNCQALVNVTTGVCEYLDKKTNEKTYFNLDSLNSKDIYHAGIKLASLTIKKDNANFELPKRVSLLELYGIKDINGLNIIERWKNNRTYQGMNVPIGIREDGKVFHLDVHETGYGPHGLIAGTTGSGKSELLQTVIISLAINFHPHDVVFVLIDYKGGGTADIFANMPHLVGTITNLGGNQTTRALISIKSELQRRQKLFSQSGVNNIDKYQKLYHNQKVSTPIPHLIMIADEFAELKAEQPEFMKELVSTARVGRSLGVHLILATQKPSGVVDDQIWSNSKFKICLKVQDDTDSQDVIKRPDASMIKEPGRAFIQVGNDEIFELFQSAYAGTDYDPLQEKLQNNNIDKNIYRVLLNGRCEKIYPKNEEKIAKLELPSQLETSVKYINSIAQDNNITVLSGPWLPPLPEIIYLDNFIDESSKHNRLCPKLGIVDDPKNQNQFPLEFDFVKNGNILIYGMQGSGKTVFLQSLCMILAHNYSVADINIYIMDFAGSTFKQFERLPHVGGIITITEEEKLNQFVLFIFRIIEERKELFEKNYVDSFLAYKEKCNDKIPAIIIIIDNYYALSESYEDLDEEITVLTREGIKYGIYFVVTALNNTLVKYRFSINFKTAVVFSLTDKDEYDIIVGRCEGLKPASNQGRGLIRADVPLEFQTTLPVFKGDHENSKEDLLVSNVISEGLEKIFIEFEKKIKVKKLPIAKKIPQMPHSILFDEINEHPYSNGLVNIGLIFKNLERTTIDLIRNNVYLITGDRSTGKSSLLMSISKYILSDSKSVIYAKDSTSMGIYNLMRLDRVNNIDDIEDTDAFIKTMGEVIAKRRTLLNECKKSGGDLISLLETLPQILFVIDDLIGFIENSNYELIELLLRIIKRDYDLKIAIVCAAHIDNICGCYEDLAQAIKAVQCGVFFGSIKEQDLFNVRIPYFSYEKKFEVGEGYHIIKNSFECVKIAN